MCVLTGSGPGWVGSLLQGRNGQSREGTFKMCSVAFRTVSSSNGLERADHC